MSRDFDFAISENSGVTWLTISGINTWSFTIDSNSEDTSTIDNGAWGSSLYTQRTGSMSLEGFKLLDAVTGVRDQGQLACEKASTKVGYEAYRDFRIRCVPTSGGVPTTPIGQLTFTGQAAMGDLGGSSTDVEPWQMEIMMEGQPVGSGIFNIIVG